MIRAHFTQVNRKQFEIVTIRTSVQLKKMSYIHWSNTCYIGVVYYKSLKFHIFKPFRK